MRDLAENWRRDLRQHSSDAVFLLEASPCPVTEEEERIAARTLAAAKSAQRSVSLLGPEQDIPIAALALWHCIVQVLATGPGREVPPQLSPDLAADLDAATVLLLDSLPRPLGAAHASIESEVLGRLSEEDLVDVRDEPRHDEARGRAPRPNERDIDAAVAALQEVLPALDAERRRKRGWTMFYRVVTLTMLHLLTGFTTTAAVVSEFDATLVLLAAGTWTGLLYYMIGLGNRHQRAAEHADQRHKDLAMLRATTLAELTTERRAQHVRQVAADLRSPPPGLDEPVSLEMPGLISEFRALVTKKDPESRLGQP